MRRPKTRNENEFYVIILDGDEMNPDDWEYVVRRDTLPEIRAVRVYSPYDKETKSKKEYAGKYIEPTTVTSITSGKPASGKIYRLTKKVSKSIKKAGKSKKVRKP